MGGMVGRGVEGQLMEAKDISDVKKPTHTEKTYIHILMLTEEFSPVFDQWRCWARRETA
jgi:hypothetical protein